MKRLIAILFSGLAVVLVGCASVPYWENPQWVNALGLAISNSLRYPDAAAEHGFPAGDGTVQFTYDQGKLTDVSIAKSTGNQILDDAIVAQVTKTNPPLARGLSTDTARTFDFPVSLHLKDAQLFRDIHAVLLNSAHYPDIAATNGNQALVVVQFEYRNGVILNPRVVKTMGTRLGAFQEAVLKELVSVKMPQPPAWAHDKTFQLAEPFCFTVRGYVCPGTDFEVHYLSAPPPSNQDNKPICTDVAFQYHGNRITNVHVLHSSGTPEVDTIALQTVINGKFPEPSTALRKRISNFNIPICYHYVAKPSANQKS